jgi:hypothetical protein
LLKKLAEYLRLQWGQHIVQIRSDDVDIQQFANEQNDVISKVEIRNEARPTEVKSGERKKNYNSREASTITKRVQFADLENTNRCTVTNFLELTTNQDGILLKITDSISVAC